MKTITGNLLDVRAGTILHQVNCRGACGGLAGALQRRYPVAFTSYFTHVRRGQERALGTFVLGQAEPGLYVGHVFGQLEPGANTDLTAVSESLAEAIDSVVHPVYAPFKMGCGLGGGSWPHYLALLETYFPEITIMQRPEDARHG